MKDYSTGDKHVLAAIFELAVNDAISFKKPREFKEVMRIKVHKKTKEIETIYTYLPLDESGNIIPKKKKPHRRGIPSWILHSHRKSREKQDGDLLKKEALSWDARRFLSKDNPLFRTYMGIMDFNPDWVHEKVWARITYHDNLT
jgi:hypothetical protein